MQANLVSSYREMFLRFNKSREKFGLWLYKKERKIDPEYRGSICLEYPEINQDLIEPRIRSLVFGMNQSGYYKTIASCQGHISYFPYPHVSVNQPYVYFKAEEIIYIELYKKLLDVGSAPVKMRYGFAVPKLLMHPTLGVCMAIDLRYGNKCVTRKQIDVDIKYLEQVVLDTANHSPAEIRNDA